MTVAQVFLGRGGDGGHVGETSHPTQEVLDAPVDAASAAS